MELRTGSGSTQLRYDVTLEWMLTSNVCSLTRRFIESTDASDWAYHDVIIGGVTWPPVKLTIPYHSRNSLHASQVCSSVTSSHAATVQRVVMTLRACNHQSS